MHTYFSTSYSEIPFRFADIPCLQANKYKHPDSIILSQGITPFLLASLVVAPDADTDLKLWYCMLSLLERGASITQSYNSTGLTALHLLAGHTSVSHVENRIKSIDRILKAYQKGAAGYKPPAGLVSDTLLNVNCPSCTTPQLAVHPLGMRCHRGKLPEERASGVRRAWLEKLRLHLPAHLRDCGKTGRAVPRVRAYPCEE